MATGYTKSYQSKIITKSSKQYTCLNDLDLPAEALLQISANRYLWQTWLRAMHYSQKMFHFLSVSNGPTSISSDVSITLRKSQENIFVGYFRKITYTCERYFWDASETSQNSHFEICSRRLKDLTWKTTFWRCFRDILKMPQKRHLFEDVFEMSYRLHKNLSLLRCFEEVSEMSLSMETWLRSLKDIYAGWVSSWIMFV